VTSKVLTREVWDEFWERELDPEIRARRRRYPIGVGIYDPDSGGIVVRPARAVLSIEGGRIVTRFDVMAAPQDTEQEGEDG
jgi:hypothetical protein